MTTILLIIGVALGVVMGMAAGDSVKKKSLAAANRALREKKKQAKASIIGLLNKNKKITNQDVERLLDVSDATATNYLEELEKEGKIVQQGKRGRGVFYKKTAKMVKI